jgi:hypothetical protein
VINYDNDFGTMLIQCDEVGCNNEIECHGDWQSCIDEAKAAGWKVRRDGAEWTYTCPEDAEEQERAFWND